MLSRQYLVTAALPLIFSYGIAVNTDTANICSQLNTQFPAKIAYPPSSNSTQSPTANLTAAYTEAQSRYWDTANADDIPGCVFFPSTAQDVSVAMQLLNKAPSVRFALKSGGHNWNRGFSSTDGGVLISFRPNMNYTRLAADTNSAEIGPGSRWGEVMAVLDPHDRCVVGGRVGDVGVGGYVPLGGISYLTSQYGFASDNVLNFEVVTANGTIINANRTSNPDVFFAIRGGGNLFGVVTKYTLATHPIGNVWGGIKAYTEDKFPQVFSAISNFTANFNESKAAIIPTMVFVGGSSSGIGGPPLFNVSFFWDGDQPPAHVFAEFDAIPHISDNCETQRYPELLNVTMPSGIPLRSTDAVSSLPNMPEPQMTDFFTRHYSQIRNASFHSAPGLILNTMAFQSIPVALQKANFDRGPAALSTNPDHGDKIWIEYDLAWSDPKYDQTWPQELLSLVQTGRDLQQTQYPGVKPTNYKSGDLDWVPYNPLLANDASGQQPVFQSYGKDTWTKMKKLHAEMDPNNMLLLQTSGFQF